MMPWNVFRIWGLGLFSWLLLGAGIYCLWEWSDRSDVALNEALLRDAAQGEVDPIPEDDRALGYLIAGTALVAWSLFGFLPVTMLLGRPRLGEPRTEERGSSQYVERPDGTRLYVEVSGSPDGPTLICTHGWSLDNNVWYYAKRQLGDRYRIVTWDLPGLGRSTGPNNGDYRLEKMAADLDAVVEAVAPGAPVFLIGHSIGGMIAQTYCRLFQEKLRRQVAGIVLVHTTYTNPLQTALLASLWKPLEKPLIVPMNYLTIALSPLAWLSNWQGYLNGSLQIATRISSFAGDQTWGQIDYASRLCAKASPAVVARGNLAMLRFDEQATLPQVEVPVLVVGGRHDRMTKVDASERIDQQLPHGLLTTIDAGHLGLWERHDDVCSAIDEFVQKFAPLAGQPEPHPAEARNTSSRLG